MIGPLQAAFAPAVGISDHLPIDQSTAASNRTTSRNTERGRRVSENCFELFQSPLQIGHRTLLQAIERRPEPHRHFLDGWQMLANSPEWPGCFSGFDSSAARSSWTRAGHIVNKNKARLAPVLNGASCGRSSQSLTQPMEPD